MAAPEQAVARGRLAWLTFVAVELGGAVAYVVNGRKVWFFGVFGDEWDFLAGRRLTIHDLLLGHGDHLVALPALVFRITYSVFGLRSYLPYQLLSIGLHLIAAALLRVVMRRAGVRPWIATAAAGLFVLFGSGSQDILIAFQITFTGALVLGLTQLMLADHGGPIDRRDGIALLAGLGALLCSDVAIVMIAAVGLTALLRRRWRALALHTLPLAAVYLGWLGAYGRGPHTDIHLSQVTSSVRTSLSSSFGALGVVPLAGWALAILLLVGLVLAITDSKRSPGGVPISAPIALAVAALAFALMLAITRFGLGARFAASSRYLHVIAALVIPALAVAADAVARRGRMLGIVVIALLLVGVPGNIERIGRNVGPAARYREQRRVISALPRTRLAGTVPRTLHPTPSFASEVTVGWLLDAEHAGRIPAPGRASSTQRATDRLRLSLEQLERADVTACVTLRSAVVRRLARGETLDIRGTVAVQSRSPVSQPLTFGTSLFDPARTHSLVAVAGALELRIAPRSLGAAICR